MADINYTVTDESGAEGELTASDLFEQLKEGGFNPVGISPDGQSISMSDDAGTFSRPVAEIAQHFGHQIKGMTPVDAGTEGVRPAWRFALQSLPDDASKQVYLKGKIQREYGVAEPQIMGNGRDWYFFHPGNQTWEAITNHPDWDISDAAEAAPAAAKAVTSGVGMVGGAALGSGLMSIPGAMAGAGVGSLAANAALRGITAAVDPEFRSATSFGEQAKASGIEAGIDATAGGLLKGAGTMFGAMKGASNPLVKGMGAMGGAAVNAAPVSTATRMAGAATNIAGEATEAVGGFISKQPLAAEALQYTAPLVSGPSNIGLMAEMLGKAPSGITGWLAKPEESAILKRLLSEESQAKVANWAKELGAPRGKVNPIEQWSAEARGVRGPADQFNAKNVFGNSAERTTRSILKPFGPKTVPSQGLTPGSGAVDDIGEEAFQTKVPGYLTEEQISNYAQRAGKVGESVGRGFENLGRAGEMVTSTGKGAIMAGAKAAQYGGNVAKNVGRATELTGAAGQPLESYLWTRYMMRKLREKNPWLGGAGQGSINQELKLAEQ